MLLRGMANAVNLDSPWIEFPNCWAGLKEKMISAWNFGNYYGMLFRAVYFRVRFEIERTPDAV